MSGASTAAIASRSDGSPPSIATMTGRLIRRHRGPAAARRRRRPGRRRRSRQDASAAAGRPPTTRRSSAAAERARRRQSIATRVSPAPITTSTSDPASSSAGRPVTSSTRTPTARSPGVSVAGRPHAAAARPRSGARRNRHRGEPEGDLVGLAQRRLRDDRRREAHDTDLGGVDRASGGSVRRATRTATPVSSAGAGSDGQTANASPPLPSAAAAMRSTRRLMRAPPAARPHREVDAGDGASAQPRLQREAAAVRGHDLGRRSPGRARCPSSGRRWRTARAAPAAGRVDARAAIADVQLGVVAVGDGAQRDRRAGRGLAERVEREVGEHLAEASAVAVDGEVGALHGHSTRWSSAWPPMRSATSASRSPAESGARRDSARPPGRGTASAGRRSAASAGRPRG